MIAAWIGAALIGASLGLFGSGGSLLTVPLLTLLLGRSAHAAVAESAAIVALISAFGALQQARRGRLDGRIALLFIATGALGAPAGAVLHRRVPEAWTELAFALLIVGAAGAVWRRAHAAPRAARPFALVPALAAGLLVGVLTGFLGVGGGFLLVPALLLFGGLPLERASATSLAVIAANSTIALFAHLAGGAVAIDRAVVALVASLGIAGSVVGVALAARLPTRALQRSFALLLLVVGGTVGVSVALRAGA